MFGAFSSDSRLCVARCLQQYEAVTLKHRKSVPDSLQPLFLSYIKPHKPVTSQRLANWLKEGLGGAGIDISIFKAHSVRGASSTEASEKGVLIDDILRTAVGAPIPPFGDSIIALLKQAIMLRYYSNQECRGQTRVHKDFIL